MTKVFKRTRVITRYFDSAEQAHAVRNELLYGRRFSMAIVHLYDTSEGLADRLTAANVEAKTAKAYETRVAKGGAVLMVLAGYKPLGVAQITRDVTADMGAVELTGLVEEVYIKEVTTGSSSILSDHPHMLMTLKDPRARNHHMANWPIPLINRRKPYDEAIFPRHARMASFPIPLISKRKPFTGSIIGRHARMADMLLPLISKREPFKGSIFAPHARMANFPLPLISRRKPFTGTLIGRHTRMANWPFPHLIDGKTGTNALMPGGPRMANFPIPLLSKRKPSDRFAFPRHARMANFPLPLTSRRKPFTGSIIGRHARMADAFLPLIIKHSEGTPPPDGSKDFSLSRMLGIPALIRR